MLSKQVSSIKAKAHYGWAIFGLTFANLSVEGGIKNTSPVLFIALRDAFGGSAAATAAIFSVGGVAGALWAPVVGRLLDRLGPRYLFPLAGVAILVTWWASSFATSLWQLIIVFSILAPLGEVAVSSFTATANLAPWFPKSRGRTLGLADAGNPAGQAVFVPLAQILVSTVGWQNTMRIYGLVFFGLVAPLNFLFQRRPPLETVHAPAVEASSEATAGPPASSQASPPESWGQMARQPAVWCLVAARGCFGVGVQMLRVHLLAFMILAGYSALQAATAIGLVGILSMAGRPLAGALSDRLGREVVYTLGLGIYVAGIVLVVALGDGDRLWPLVGFVGLAGLTDGIAGLLVGAKAADLFPTRNLGTVMGMVEMGRGFGFAVGPILGGLFFDLYGSYLPAFAAALALAVVAVACMWSIRLVRPSTGTHPLIP
ncbi:MAG: MFS transporter [Dehalococcoidia bacterium]|nr:MFS transporter [Dehalococcoidia bacterium]MSQ17363.1 MFS transporter [Dehalococcoidia bacterium]